ncbi:MAG TPA: phosphoribosylformylglycinamidine cyclo-ligase [Candidatus Coproplasma excrementigallinarum]|uniref:Phosphoribosylformylglycinamidine cyclo-ligase n=1 Tax=Candidatus Coproplasma excrementigallinarum TaxID=2840747 RepID=A0A9D1SIZ2_9FIRM|nr:phosphoribosylformylglycinamidine cyclo-ligase [Candidatus Coproplasma excrementigallinarum]
MAISYKDSGVDVERGYEAVKLMKQYVKSTYNASVLGDIGSFGGFYELPKGIKNPVLVSGTDGVGTKLKYAFIAGKHNTIGIDAVAMCVNDIVCQGAKPLFFLDYFATGKLSPEVVATVVSGVAAGCRQAGAALVGGETAEMPGFYADGEYDIAGFAVGVVDKKKIINGSKIRPGDMLIGLKSSGIHSNGYSLVRKLFGEDKAALEKYDSRLGAKPIDVLLTPTRIYVRSVLSLIEKVKVKGIAHITGGGFIENIPRIFPEGVGCEIWMRSYEVPAIFKIMQEKAGISDSQIYNTFNMGIGMVICVAKRDVDKALETLKELGEDCCVIGKTTKGSGVQLIK